MSDAVLKAVVDTYSVDEPIDCVVDVDVGVLLTRKPGGPSIRRAIATVRVDVSFNPMDYGADASGSLEMSPEDGLRRIIENEIDRACIAYRLDGLLDDVAAFARCLHVLGHWDGGSILEILKALQHLEVFAVRHRYEVDDLWCLTRGWTPLPENVWPADLPKSGVLLWDRAGRTLVVDHRGRLAVGPTVAKRVRQLTLERVDAGDGLRAVANVNEPLEKADGGNWQRAAVA
jgi:hypothetical protein